MIDHPAQLDSIHAFQQISSFKFGIYIKIDTGYHRAGVLATSSEFVAIVRRIFDDLEPVGCVLHGLYSHAGHSYGGDSRTAAMSLLTEEIQGLEGAVRLVRDISSCGEASPSRSFNLSVGATPTTSSIQNIFDNMNENDPTLHERSKRLKACINRIQAKDCIELHAGVYPLLDLQQIATQASPSATGTKPSASSSPSPSTLSTSDIGLTILAEVASIYPNRSPPEALIAVGSLALGREPCKSYPGWGIVTDWGFPPVSSSSSVDPGPGHSGWQVGRISQEHGILTSTVHGEAEDGGRTEAGAGELAVGQKVRIWPNHACVAGAGFGWYVVVDSSLPERQRDEIVDIWVRWRGW